MSCFLLAFYCSGCFGSEQSSGYRVHVNKMDIALCTLIRIAIYCVCRVPRRLSISSESSFSKTENTNNPEKCSRNTQTEASDPYTWEQANIQPCCDLALVLWFVLLPVILHCILRSPFPLLALSPDSLLVPHHCTAQYFFDLHFFSGTHTACILYLVLPVISIYIVKAAINFALCTLCMFVKQTLLSTHPVQVFLSWPAITYKFHTYRIQ